MSTLKERANELYEHTHRDGGEIPFSMLFAFPTDVGHGSRCDSCGTKLFEQRRCAECGRQAESNEQVCDSAPRGDGFTGMMEALR